MVVMYVSLFAYSPEDFCVISWNVCASKRTQPNELISELTDHKWKSFIPSLHLKSNLELEHVQTVLLWVMWIFQSYTTGTKNADSQILGRSIQNCTEIYITGLTHRKNIFGLQCKCGQFIQQISLPNHFPVKVDQGLTLCLPVVWFGKSNNFFSSASKNGIYLWLRRRIDTPHYFMFVSAQHGNSLNKWKSIVHQNNEGLG